MRTCSELSSGKFIGRRSAARCPPPRLSSEGKRGFRSARDAACPEVLAAPTGAVLLARRFTGACSPVDILPVTAAVALLLLPSVPEFRRIYNPLLDALFSSFFPGVSSPRASIRAGRSRPGTPDSFYSGSRFWRTFRLAVLYPLNALFYVIDPARSYGYVVTLHTLPRRGPSPFFLRVLGPSAVRQPSSAASGSCSAASLSSGQSIRRPCCHL